MNGRLLDTNNDIYMDPVTGRVCRAETFKERTMRLIGTVLRTFQGECFTDYNAGVPWFDRVLGNSVLFADEIGAEIKDKVLEVQGVESVEDMMVEIDGRNLSGRYKVRLSNGEIVTGASKTCARPSSMRGRRHSAAELTPRTLPRTATTSTLKPRQSTPSRSLSRQSLQLLTAIRLLANIWTSWPPFLALKGKKAKRTPKCESEWTLQKRPASRLTTEC